MLIEVKPVKVAFRECVSVCLFGELSVPSHLKEINLAATAKKEAEPMLLHYHTLMDYLGWTSVGEVVASGVWTAGSVRNTDYPQQVYKLGKSL